MPTYNVRAVFQLDIKNNYEQEDRFIFSI